MVIKTLSSKSIFEYRKNFPSDSCFFNEPGSGILIESKSKQKAFISPPDETDEIFLNRLIRCKETGRNLFYEEWETFEYISGYIY